MDDTVQVYMDDGITIAIIIIIIIIMIAVRMNVISLATTCAMLKTQN